MRVVSSRGGRRTRRRQIPHPRFPPRGLLQVLFFSVTQLHGWRAPALQSRCHSMQVTRSPLLSAHTRRGVSRPLALVRKSLHSRRSMLAGQQITALTKINARSSEFEPKYLRTSIALWVDGGSQETQYSVLSTRYSVHSVFSSWYSVLNTQEHCLAAVPSVVIESEPKAPPKDTTP